MKTVLKTAIVYVFIALQYHECFKASSQNGRTRTNKLIATGGASFSIFKRAQVSKGRVYLWGEVLIKSCQQINHFWLKVLEKTVRVFLARKVNMSKTRCDEKPNERKLNSRPARVVLSVWVVSYLVLLSTWGETSIVLEVFL